MSDKVQASSGGMSVCGVLGVVFIVLKLCGVIDWSWWWVLAPFWGSWAIGLLILGAVLFVAMKGEQ